MNAQPSNRLSASSPHQQVTERVKRQSRSSRSSRKAVHRVLAAELSARLGVNVLVGCVAVSALVTLIPYNWTQEAKLRELQTEVAEVEKRVDRLREEFDRHFDPQQAISVMQEQSIRVNPNQRQVIWTSPSSNIADHSAEAATPEQQQAWKRQ